MVVIRISENCRDLQIKLVIEWIPKEADQSADYLSKLCDINNWTLKGTISGCWLGRGVLHIRSLRVCMQRIVSLLQ